MPDENNDIDLNELMSVADVAKELGVTDDWVRKLIRSEKLPASKLGKIAYVVKRSDLIKYIEHNNNDTRNN